MFSTAANASADDYKITATAADAGTGDDYNESPATFVLRVTGESTGAVVGIGVAPRLILCSIPPLWTLMASAAGSRRSRGCPRRLDGRATIEYATEVNGGPKSAYSATASVLSEGITTVYAKAVSGTYSSETIDIFKVDTRLPNLNISGAPDGTNYDVCATLNGNGPSGRPSRPAILPPARASRGWMPTPISAWMRQSSTLTSSTAGRLHPTLTV